MKRSKKIKLVLSGELFSNMVRTLSGVGVGDRMTLSINDLIGNKYDISYRIINNTCSEMIKNDNELLNEVEKYLKKKCIDKNSFRIDRMPPNLKGKIYKYIKKNYK